MKNLKELIGDYQAFFSDLLHRQSKIGINIEQLPLSHLLYRVTTLSEYEALRDQLKLFCKEYVETQFNDRAVAILVLKEELILEGDFKVSVIELPAPRAAHMYPSGLESIGVVVGAKLQEFIVKYKKVLTGIKDHGQYCQPAFVTFDNDKTSKFYDISLTKIIALQGWQLEKFI